MAALAVFSHPFWFICSLLLSAALWIRGRHRWHPEACLVDLTGKTAIVTGASSGIGKWVAHDLARRNARTILACRSRERGEAALEEIRRSTGNPQVQLRILDTSSMASVQGFARQFLKEEGQLDILVNNAGASGLPHRITEEGLELLFATNVLGPFLLTNLLLDLLKASSPARIVNVSSVAHYQGEANVRFLTGEEPPKSSSQAYSSSKLMNVALTSELARRLHGTGTEGEGSLAKSLGRRCHLQKEISLPSWKEPASLPRVGLAQWFSTGECPEILARSTSDEDFWELQSRNIWAPTS